MKLTRTLLAVAALAAFGTAFAASLGEDTKAPSEKTCKEKCCAKECKDGKKKAEAKKQ
jgi:hypothetical protein